MKNHGYLRHLANFGYVVEAGSMSAAARQLDVSPSVLSDSVRILEARLGQPLLERGRTGVKPTAMGKIAMEEAQQILSALDRALGPEARPDMTGPVNITLGAELVDWIAPAVTKLTQDHPDLTLTLMPEDTLLDELRHTRDLYMRVSGPGGAGAGGLTTLESWPVSAGLFGAPDLLEDPLNAEIADIEALPCLTGDVDGDICTLKFSKEMRLQFRKRVIVTGIAPRIALARQGAGVVACLAPTAVAAPGLTRIRPDILDVTVTCTIGSPLRRPTPTLRGVAAALATAAKRLI